MKRYLPIPIGALILFCLIAFPPGSWALTPTTPVYLNALTTPSSGVAGSNVNLTGAGFPSGVIPPGNVTISLATTCGGSAVTTTALSVKTILGSSDRIQFQIPAALAAGGYFVSMSGTTSGGASFVSSNRPSGPGVGTGQCSALAVTQTPTSTPTATPTPFAPVISLSSSCTPDAVGTFIISNIGSNMTSPGTWTLLLNGTPLASNSFQLNAGQNTQITTSGLFGTLELDTSGGGAVPASTSTFCQSPTPTPTPLPPIISLSSSCTPDAVGTFIITNIGSNMTSPGTWTLLLNGTPIASNNFQLNAGQHTQVNTSGLFGTLELDTSGGGAAPASTSTFCQSPTATPR